MNNIEVFAVSSDLDLKKTKDDLMNKFIHTAEYFGKPKVAQVMREILPLLTTENVEREIDDGVTELSKKAKEDALVEPEKSLEIVGIFPDWWRLEKGIIKEKTEKGPVRFRPRGYEMMPKDLEKDIRKAGVKIIPSSGVISLNLASNSCTFYYTPKIFVSPSDPNRLGIRITGKPLKILTKHLNAVRKELFTEEPPLGRITEEIYAVRALKSICENSSDLHALIEVMRNEKVPLEFRITLLLHCLQIHKDKYYSVFEISKELESSLESVRSQIFSWYKDRKSTAFSIFDFHITEEKEITVKLLPAARSCWAPGAFLQVLIFAAVAGDDKAKDLMQKYDLPPLGKKKPFAHFWLSR